MGNEELIQILSEKIGWFDERAIMATHESDFDKLSVATDETISFIEFLRSIGVPIDSEKEMLAFEELRKFAHQKYSDSRYAFTRNYYRELSSLINHLIHQISAK